MLIVSRHNLFNDSCHILLVMPPPNGCCPGFRTRRMDNASFTLTSFVSTLWQCSSLTGYIHVQKIWAHDSFLTTECLNNEKCCLKVSAIISVRIDEELKLRPRTQEKWVIASEEGKCFFTKHFAVKCVDEGLGEYFFTFVLTSILLSSVRYIFYTLKLLPYNLWHFLS